MANNSISLVSLDFDTLKTQLKTYLKSQPRFSDYDFDGSNMSVLLDILTYNTHLNAFYLNMVASEMFLDSAQLRNSAVSTAKALNYTPRSVKSSRATLNLTFPQSGLQSFSIPEGTRFTGRNSNGSFVFLTGESVVLYPSGGTFQANSLMVFEGNPTTDTFVVDYSIDTQRFVMVNDQIDTDSLRVTVAEDSSQVGEEYTLASTLYTVNQSSKVYFLQAAEGSRYEVVFGDGVFGQRPKDGAVVSCTYRVSAGDRGNGSTGFTLNDNLGTVNGLLGAVTPTIVTQSAGYGGGPAETIDEIRYRAPRHFQSQERAITTDDFSDLILQEFPRVKRVHVYGGELVTGVKSYGTIFVSPTTFTDDFLSMAEKSEIEGFLRDRMTIGLQPRVIDPNYLYVDVDTSVKFDPSNTTLSAADIESLVKTAIKAYSDNQLDNFNTEFRTSRLETAINAADVSIVSNNTEITLRKIFITELASTTFPIVEFKNEILPGSFTSSEFVAGGRRYQYTDLNPNVSSFVVQQVNGRTVVTNPSGLVYLKDLTNPDLISYSQAGTINYLAGSVSMNSIQISSYLGEQGVNFFAVPASEDVQSFNNDVISIDEESGIRVTVRQI